MKYIKTLPAITLPASTHVGLKRGRVVLSADAYSLVIAACFAEPDYICRFCNPGSILTMPVSLLTCMPFFRYVG